MHLELNSKTAFAQSIVVVHHKSPYVERQTVAVVN